MNYKDKLNLIFEDIDSENPEIKKIYNSLVEFAESIPDVNITKFYTEMFSSYTIIITPIDNFHFDPESPRIPDEGDTWGDEDNKSAVKIDVEDDITYHNGSLVEVPSVDVSRVTYSGDPQGAIFRHYKNQFVTHIGDVEGVGLIGNIDYVKHSILDALEKVRSDEL